MNSYLLPNRNQVQLQKEYGNGKGKTLRLIVKLIEKYFYD